MKTATKERPILFSGPMVRAILDGRKTQTRRIVKPQPPDVSGDFDMVSHLGHQDGLWHFVAEREHFGDHENPPCLEEHLWGKMPCPYGKPGDRLWVRETWARVNSGSGPGWTYRADGEFRQPEYDGHNYGAGPSFNYEKYPGDYCMWYGDLIGGATTDEGYRWTPSIHMPRWASRITLEVTDVRVERLQDISEQDAANEGVEIDAFDQTIGAKDYSDPTGVSWFIDWEGFDLGCACRESFRTLWESINGDGSWNENPWVWVVEFHRVTE